MLKDSDESAYNLLLSWKENMEANSLLHRKNQIFYGRLKNAFGYPALGLSSLFTVGSLTTAQECYESSFFWICVPQIIFGVIVTICLAVLTFGNFDFKGALNKTSCDRYEGVIREVEVQVNSKKPMDSTVFLSFIKSKFDDIISTSPMISNTKRKLAFTVSRESVYRVKNDTTLDKERIDKISEMTNDLQSNPEFIYQQDRLKNNFSEV